MRWPDEWKGPYREPRDVWLGVFWDHDEAKITRPDWSGVDYYERLTLYVCLLPCLPIRLRWLRPATRAAQQPPRLGGE